MADSLRVTWEVGDQAIIVGIGLAAVLCGYTHHFALMMAGFIYLTGLALVNSTDRKASESPEPWRRCSMRPTCRSSSRNLAGRDSMNGLLRPAQEWLFDYAWWTSPIAQYSSPWSSPC